MSANLRVVPNTGGETYPHHSWEIWEGSTFGCFTQKRMSAERVKKEIQQSLQRLEAKLRRYESDEPMTPLRRVYYNASRRAG